ncbi:MAG: ribonuclease Z [Candidatus Diapherotrites archaeon]|nr:ribonuclease Z [Candidatus Diapherotrites archaeon]
MKLVFLGTSGSTPTKERGLTSVALQFDGNVFLFDCPEGTQRQMMKSKTSYMKINHVFISHFHADHFLGLPGLLATMAIHGRTNDLNIFGPKGIEKKIKDLIKLSEFKLSFEIKAQEIKKGIIVKENNYSITAFPLKHEIECHGFVFKEKDKEGEFNRAKAEALKIPAGPLYSKLAEGKKIKFEGKTFSPEQVMDYSKARKGRKISIVFDTLANNSYLKQIEESDILVHESSFLEEKKARALETLHSYAKQVGALAEKAKVKKLYLIHLSPRIKEIERIENEARMEFAESFVAKDLDSIEIMQN